MKRRVTFKELDLYVTKNVAQNSRTKQMPVSGTIEGEGDFLIIRLGPAKLPNGIDITDHVESYTGMEFKFVKGDCFSMGDIFGDGDNDEKPVREICLDDYYIGKYEVRQNEWEKLMDDNPSSYKGSFFPAEGISWNAAQQFIFQLNLKGNLKHYRLPTEAEWEFAARSGGKREKYSGFNDENDATKYAWYDVNSGFNIHPTGLKSQNGLGIHDMGGNVSEWCQDLYEADYYRYSSRIQTRNPQGPDQGEYRVLRGGDWTRPLRDLRTTNRSRSKPADRISTGNGFRLVIPAIHVPKK
jgi:sulfatase modifying factor 1